MLDDVDGVVLVQTAKVLRDLVEVVDDRVGREFLAQMRREMRREAPVPASTQQRAPPPRLDPLRPPIA